MQTTECKCVQNRTNYFVAKHHVHCYITTLKKHLNSQQQAAAKEPLVFKSSSNPVIY